MTTVTAGQILSKLKKMHTQKDDPRALQDAFYTEVKTGRTQLGYLRLDAIAIKKSWVKPCIIGYEVKVKRSDFLRDKKWQNYQKYCHEFWFVCPPGVVTLEDLAAVNCGDVGLLYYSPEHDTLFTKRRAMYRKIDLRSREVVEMLYYLAVYRADGADNSSTIRRVGESS